MAARPGGGSGSGSDRGWETAAPTDGCTGRLAESGAMKGILAAAIADTFPAESKLAPEGKWDTGCQCQCASEGGGEPALDFEAACV